MGLVSDPTTEEPLDLESAKTHLRIVHSDLDGQIAELIASARDWAERFTNRTLRAVVKRTCTGEDWPANGWKLPWPPLIQLGDPDDEDVWAISYYDTDDTLQELSAESYWLDQSTDAAARLIWADGVTLPDLAVRPDAVTIRFATGYGANLPAAAVMAIKVKLTELFGGLTPSELDATRRCAMNLLRELDATPYR